MGWASVSWLFKSLITSQKLNQMDENTDIVYDFAEFLHLVSDFVEYSEASTTVVTKRVGKVYIPANCNNVKIYVMLWNSLSATTSVYIWIDTLHSDFTVTGATPEHQSADLDVSSLSPGWYDFKIKMKTSNYTAYLNSVSVFAERDGT